MNEEVWAALVNMIGRAVINNVTVEEDGTVTLNQDLLNDETIPDVELFQQYGFSSVPLKDAEALTIFMGGDRSNGVTIATEDARYRIKNMEGGEVAIYTDEGDMIHFQRNRKMKVETVSLEIIAATEIDMKTPLVKASGNMSVVGTVTAGAISAGSISASGTISAASVSDSAGSLAAVRAKGDAHLHGLVTPGTANSGPPVTP